MMEFISIFIAVIVALFIVALPIFIIVATVLLALKYLNTPTFTILLVIAFLLGITTVVYISQ